MAEALSVLDPVMGELLNLNDATPEELARCMTNIGEHRETLAEHEALVSDELVKRMDREAKWTLHVGDPKVQMWEISAPSPSAGTDVYPADMLETELRALVERGTITTDAADAALKRVVTVQLAVPLTVTRLDEIVAYVKTMATFTVNGVELKVLAADHRSGAVKAGINALLKVPGTGAALARAKRTEPGGPRRVKVKHKARLS